MQEYKTPSEDMRSFLVETVPKLSGMERLENQSLAQLLITKHRGKTEFSTNEIGNSFSWLHQIGVLSYDKVYVPSGGWRLHLYRACDEDDVERLISLSGDISLDDSTETEPVDKPKKKKASCCDSPHIVKSKKTGSRKCKNCGKPRPDKKPAALASSCCDNPHPVKSKKTGKRKCKNCGKPLPRKNKQ